MASRIICIDAGMVICRVAFPDEATIQRIWDEWEKEGIRLIAPSLLYYEVTSVLYRYQRYGLFSSLTVQNALSAAMAIQIDLYGDPGLHLRACEMAMQYNLPAVYDAHYLALAERYGAEMYTIDRKLITAMDKKIPSWIHHITPQTDE